MATDLNQMTYEGVFYELDTSDFDGSRTGTSITFKPDGTQMYIQVTGVNALESTAYQYILSEPWIVSSASFEKKDSGVIDITERETSQGIQFSSDGRKIFLLDDTLNGVAFGNALYEYDLGIPWDVSTIVDNNTAPTGGGKRTSRNPLPKRRASSRGTVAPREGRDDSLRSLVEPEE